MNRKKRIEYLACTLAACLSGALSYGAIGVIVGVIVGQTVPSSKLPLTPALFFLVGIMGAILFGSIISTIILTANFLKNRGLVFKIVATFFWPVTYFVSFFVGFFIFVPYEIYNIIKIFTSEE